MKTKQSTLLLVAQLLTLLLGGTVAQLWAADPPTGNEVWISALNSGTYIGQGSAYIFGNGNPATPFYGDFDAIVNSRPANTTIHLLPGTFYTKGYTVGQTDAYELKAYQRIIGAGIDITTVRRDNRFHYDTGSMYGVLATLTAEGVEVRDLTLDAGATGNEMNKQQAVMLAGNYCKIQRVKAIHTSGHYSTGQECFSVSVAGDPTGARVGKTRCMISEVEVSSVLGDYCSAIDLVEGDGGIVQNCRVVFPPPPAGAYLYQGYTMAGVFDASFLNNYCEGGTTGFYSDTGSLTNLTIANNTCKNVYAGVGILVGDNGYNVDGLTLRDNVIEIRAEGGWGFLLSNGDLHPGDNSVYRNVNIVGNTIKAYNNAIIPPGSVSIHVSGANPENYIGVKILDNTLPREWTLDSNPNAVQWNAKNIWLADNMDTNGVPLHVRQVGAGSAATVDLVKIDGSVLVSSSTTTAITLPTAFGFSAKEISISNQKASGSLTINPASNETIAPSGSFTLASGATARLISDGSSVWIKE